MIAILLFPVLSFSADAPTQKPPTRDELMQTIGANSQMIRLIYEDADKRAQPFQEAIKNLRDQIAQMDAPKTDEKVKAVK